MTPHASSTITAKATPDLLVLVALPGELWLVAGVLMWPLGAWLIAAGRRLPGSRAWLVFARAAAVAGVLAVLLVSLGAYLFATDGTTGAFQALAAQIGAGVTLLGALLCGSIALTIRWRAERSTEQPKHDGRP